MFPSAQETNGQPEAANGGRALRECMLHEEDAMTDVGERDSGLPKLARFEVVRRIGDGGMGIDAAAVEALLAASGKGTTVAAALKSRAETNVDAETLALVKRAPVNLPMVEHKGSWHTLH